jgi:cytoskeleton protein RodZ
VAIGARLQEIRKEQGRSLESIAAGTRIPPRILAAIERDDFDAVPSGIFLRGYLRAFAGELGLDPSEVLAAYGEDIAPAVADEPRYPAPGETAGEGSPDRRLTSVFVLTGAAMLLLVVFLWPRGEPAAQDAFAPTGAEPLAATGTEDVAGLTPVSTASAPEPAASPGDRVARRPAAAEQSGVTLVAREAVWVTATADGERVLFRTLEANERVTLTVRQRLELRVGDAGKVDFAVGGAAPAPLGRAGQVRTLTVERQGGGLRVN